MERQSLDRFDVERLVPGFRSPPCPAAAAGEAAADAAAVAAADTAMRHWRSPHPGPLVPGSDAHREASCRMFRDTFNPYRPAVLDWPVLAPAVRERIVS
ncbi:MAG: ferritin-like domain-containing protein, partial [Oxalobacteraceae bacterium]